MSDGHQSATSSSTWVESQAEFNQYLHEADAILQDVIGSASDRAAEQLRAVSDLVGKARALMTDRWPGFKPDRVPSEQAAQLQAAHDRLVMEMAERQQVERQVRLLNAQLELRVAERTAQLEAVNEDLKIEIAERQKISRALRGVLRRTREQYRISQTIGSVRSVEEVLQALLSSSYLHSVSRASIAIFDTPWLDDGHTPTRCDILAAWNREPDLPAFEGQHLTLQEYGLAPPYSPEKPIVIRNVQAMRRLPPRVRQRFELLKTRGLIIFPLIAAGVWYGALSLHFKTSQAINDDDLRHVRGLVDQTAIAIDALRLLVAEAQARREAEQANELKLKFLAMISHELRTPLTSIKGFATTLLADDVQWDFADQRDFLHTISAESDKLSELIEQLLDLSRLEAGILRIVPKRRTFDDILSSAMAQLRTITARHQLILDVPADLPPLVADAQRLGQVLVNLVGNAARYAPPQTQITIAARLTGDTLQVDVTDQGPGIPLQERVRIFEPFQQIEAQSIHPSNGAGLGLAICKGLIEAHGGRIWVQDGSEPGTTISFTLPVRTDLPV